MPLQYFDFKKDDTRLVKCDDTVYKVKILPQGSLQNGLPCSIQGAHKQIEDVFRAMLYMDQRSVIFKPVHTVDFIVNTKKKRWKTCENLSFQINGRPLKACPYQFILKINLKNPIRNEIRSSRETNTVAGPSHDSHMIDVQVRHNKEVTRNIDNSDLHNSDTLSKTTRDKKTCDVRKKNTDSVNVSMVTGGEKSKRKSVDEEKDPKEIVQTYKNIQTSIDVSVGDESAVRNETSIEENDDERNRQALRKKIRERERKKNEELRKKEELNKVFNESVISKGSNKRRKLYNAEMYCKTPLSSNITKYNTRNSVKSKDGVKASYVRAWDNVVQTGGTKNYKKGFDKTKTTRNKSGKDSQTSAKSASQERGPSASQERGKSASRERGKPASQDRGNHEDVLHVEDRNEGRMELRKGDMQDSYNSVRRKHNSQSSNKNRINSGVAKDESSPQQTTRSTRSVSSERNRKNSGRKLKQGITKKKLNTVHEIATNPQGSDALHSVKPIRRTTLSKCTRSTPRKSSCKDINKKGDMTQSPARRESVRLQKNKIISPVTETGKNSQESTSSSSCASSGVFSGKVNSSSKGRRKYPLRSRTKSLSPYGTRRKDSKSSNYRRSYRNRDKNNSSENSPKIDLFRPFQVLGNESERLEKLKTTSLDTSKRKQHASRQQLDRHEIEKEEVREYMKLQKMSKSGSPVKSPRHSPGKRKLSGFWDFVDAFITPVKRVLKG